MNFVCAAVMFFIVTMNSVIEIEMTVFADITSMEVMIEKQAHIIDFFSPRLDVMKFNRSKRIVSKFLARCQLEHSIAIRNVSQYLMNPINSYRLLKRLIFDFDFVRRILVFYFNDTMKLFEFEELFTNETLKDAGAAITSLITHYELAVEDLSNGTLKVKKRLFFRDNKDSEDVIVYYATPLLASECYLLSLAALRESHFDIALKWLDEARRKYDEECENDCTFSLANYVSVEEDIRVARYRVRKRPQFDLNDLCAGVHDPEGLNCEYRYGPHRFLRLARFKTEQIHLDPEIIMFHDVISDKEIAIVENLSSSRWMTALTTDTIPVKVSNRINKVALLVDAYERTLRKLSLRVLDMSGRSTGVSLAEPWQVSLYGPGGYFKIHHDARVKWTQFRNSTTMFYATDNQLGGATTFNNLNLSVKPRKYSALHWQNLLQPAGGSDNRTLHASCPLLYGTKMVIIKWLSDVEESCPITMSAETINDTENTEEDSRRPCPLFRLSYSFVDNSPL